MSNKVVVFGNTVLSRMLFYDATGDDTFQIACFTADGEYIDGREFMGLPLIDSQQIARRYPPNEYDMIAVLGGYRRMRDREVFFRKALSMGYRLRNYISRKADVLPQTTMGVNNIILGYAHLGMGGCMKDNNMIRQNVYLGHDFDLGSHNTIAAGSTIGGNCRIRNLCYIGMGSTVVNNIAVEEETLLGAGSVVIRNTEPYSKNVGNPSRIIGYHREEGIQMSVESQ